MADIINTGNRNLVLDEEGNILEDVIIGEELIINGLDESKIANNLKITGTSVTTESSITIGDTLTVNGTGLSFIAGPTTIGGTLTVNPSGIINCLGTGESTYTGNLKIGGQAYSEKQVASVSGTNITIN